jgi:hypothetical protein
VSVGLYMDVHVPRVITLGLRSRGVDVLTAQEDNAAEYSDPDLLDRAMSLERLLFTQDKDFLIIAAQRQNDGVLFGGIVFAPQNSSIGRLIHDLELIGILGAPEEFANRLEFLPY